MTAPSRPKVQVGELSLGGGELFLLAGPCVLETPELAHQIAETLVGIARERRIPLVFKASFDKANRSSAAATRGPGIAEGLELLAEIKRRWNVPVVTDVHLPEHCAPAAEVCDLLQIPAFLCRQTDLLVAAARTGKPLNIKKGQFLAPWDMKNVVAKCAKAGNPNVMVCERGTSFGYGRLVVDMTGFEHLRATEDSVEGAAAFAAKRPPRWTGR